MYETSLIDVGRILFSITTSTLLESIAVDVESMSASNFEIENDWLNFPKLFPMLLITLDRIAELTESADRVVFVVSYNVFTSNLR